MRDNLVRISRVADTCARSFPTFPHMCTLVPVLQGIHNMFIVIPQFLVTGLASIIFAIVDPGQSVLHGHQAGNTPPGDETLTPSSEDAVRRLFARSGDVSQTGPNSIVIVFRSVQVLNPLLPIHLTITCPCLDWEASQR